MACPHCGCPGDDAEDDDSGEPDIFRDTLTDSPAAMTTLWSVFESGTCITFDFDDGTHNTYPLFLA